MGKSPRIRYNTEMKVPQDSLLLIDGHALLYRAFHALPPLKTRHGLQTNALYGFVTTVFKALEEVKPKYWAVAFDVGKTTFRTQLFEGYKASRVETPDDLRLQIPYAYKIAEALNIPIFTYDNFEADDVIGTLAHQAKKQAPVIILTGDRDSFQLINDTTLVYLMRRSAGEVTFFDAAAVKESMGITPEQIIDYKALAGDSSDEIPGIPGIGPKTATIILSAFPSIEKLYEGLKAGKEIPGITERIRQKLIDGETSARQSLELATIRKDVPITFDLKATTIHDYDFDQAQQLFQELEFFSLIKRLHALAPSSKMNGASPMEESDWHNNLVVTEEAIKQLIEELRHAQVLAIDTETDGINGPIIGVSLSADGKNGYYIPTVKEHGATLTPARLAELLKPLLENEMISKIGHNVKYDMHALDHLGINLQGDLFDTMIAAYILYAHMRSFDLDTLSQRELGYTKVSFKDLAGRSKEASLLTVETDKVCHYACEDVVMTYRLYEIFRERLVALPQLDHVSKTIDFPLIRVLKEMEDRGVCLNVSLIGQLEKDLEQEITQLRAIIEQYSHEPININSPTQLQKMLFTDLGLTNAGMKTTKTGISTAAGELEKLQGLHPVIDAILRYRELTKLQSTYVQTLPKLVDKDNRLHTEFSQSTAATGRLASNNPNLQNIPIRTELGNKIREAFVAPKGYQLVSIDYSQIELRLIAELSGDKNLKQAFIDGRDIHDEVAKRLNIERRAAKTINFGILYGLSAFGLSQSLKIPQLQAKQYIDAYFANYPDLTRYLQDTKQQIRDKGYVETLFGRRREIPEIQASNAMVRAAAERMAINMPAQGTAADIMKLAMIETNRWLHAEFDQAKDRPYLVLQVHDELLLEVPHDLVVPVTAKVKSIMETVCQLAVPLVAEPKGGHNWREMTKIEVSE